MADTRESLTAEEEDIFNSEWSPLLTRHFRVREVMDIFEDHRDAILEAARIAKYELEATFGGANARTNEFGWMPIMPQHLLTGHAVIDSYADVTWDRDITTSDVTTVTDNTVGWMDWIGSSSASRKLSKYATMIIIGFYDPVPEPKVDTILAKIKSTDYPMWYFGDLFAETDYHVMELTTPFVIEKEQDFYLQKHCIKAGTDSLRPHGIMSAKGDYMRDKGAYGSY